MGSGVSSHTSNDHIDVGMRGQKFKERHHGTAPEPRPTKRKSFIQRMMHYGNKSEKAKKRWNHFDLLLAKFEKKLQSLRFLGNKSRKNHLVFVQSSQCIVNKSRFGTSCQKIISIFR